MLHPYATDSKERYAALFFVAILALGTAFGIAAIADYFHVRIPWWLDFPGPFGLYAIWFYLLDRFIWRWRWLRAIRIIVVPNLNGKWDATIKSSYDEFRNEHLASVTIEQSWSGMMIRLNSKSSSSFSLVGSILLHSAQGPILSYQYQNEPTADAVKTMQTHIGTAWLRLDLENYKMEGNYYSGRGRENHGSIVLRKANG